MEAVEDFIYETEGQQRSILEYFHHLLTVDLGLDAKIRFKIPFYFQHSWICYLNPIKNDGIELAFTRGNELSNAQGLLENKGRKQIFGIEVYDVNDLNEEALFEVLQEALLLDETVPYASKRKEKK